MIDKEKYTRALQYVLENVSEEALLGQLAEEAVELAHAALKLQRATLGEAPPELDMDKVCANLLEEFGDVICVMHVLSDGELEILHGFTERIIFKKLDRWVGRIMEKKKDDKDKSPEDTPD